MNNYFEEGENKITVLVNIAIMSGMTQGMHYSFFVMAKISVPVTIRKFNHSKTKNRPLYFKDPVRTAQ